MIIRTLAAMALVCASALAQVPMIKTEILTVALENTDEVFYYSNNGEISEFASDRIGLGYPFDYQGPKRFILHTSKEAFLPPAEGEKPVPPAAFADLPEGAKRVLIVSAPAADGKINLIPYDISKGSMKNGAYRVFNFSHSNIAIILGNQKAIVGSTQNKILIDGKWDSEVLDLPCQVGVVQEDGKTIVPAFSSIWGHRPIRRNMLFVFDGKRGKDSVEIRRFYDIILQEPEAASSAN